MHLLPDNLQLKLSDVLFYPPKSKKNPRSIVQLEIIIEKVPSIIGIKKLMDNIREVIAQLPSSKYIAITDLSHLSVNKFFRNFILSGMEKSYKSFISVPKQAAISFVVLGGDAKESRLLVSSLERINTDIAHQDYQYNYYFIENRDKIDSILSKHYDLLTAEEDK
jgi:hypothetical protein